MNNYDFEYDLEGWLGNTYDQALDFLISHEDSEGKRTVTPLNEGAELWLMMNAPDTTPQS